MTDYFGERMMEPIRSCLPPDELVQRVLKSREGKEKHKITGPDGEEYWVY